MSAIVELSFKAAQDELAFYRSQVQQNGLLSFEGTVLAFLSPIFVLNVLSFFPNHAIRAPMPKDVGPFFATVAFAWVFLFIQAMLWHLPTKEKLSVSDRLADIIWSEKKSYANIAIPREVEEALARLAMLLLLPEIETEIRKLRNQRQTRLAFSFLTLMLVVGMFIAAVYAEVTLRTAGYQFQP